MALPPRGILRSNTQSTTNTTKRVTWADQPVSFLRRPPPSIVPPSRRARPSRNARSRGRERRLPREPHTCRKHQTEKAARRRRRAEGVFKKRTNIDVRRSDVKRKKKRRKSSTTSDSSKKKKCRRGLLYARQYVAGKAMLRDDMLDFVDARTMYKIYANVRRRLGKKVDDGLRRRMVDEESKFVEDKRLMRRTRKNLELFVNKMLPGVKAEAFSRSQLSRAAHAAVLARFDRVLRGKR